MNFYYDFYLKVGSVRFFCGSGRTENRSGTEPEPSGSVRFYPILRKNAKKRIHSHPVIVQRRAIARWNPIIETHRMVVKSSL